MKVFRNTSLASQIRSDKVFFSLIPISGIGLAVAAYFTVTREYIPSNRVAAFNNASHDIDVLVDYEKNINIPLESFLVHKTSPVNVFLFPNKIYPNQINVRSVDLVLNSSNSASSILSVQNPLATKTPNYWTYHIVIEAGHPLEIKNYTEQYYLEVLYRNRTSLSHDTQLSNGTVLTKGSPVATGLGQYTQLKFQYSLLYLLLIGVRPLIFG